MPSPSAVIEKYEPAAVGDNSECFMILSMEHLVNISELVAQSIPMNSRFEMRDDKCIRRDESESPISFLEYPPSLRTRSPVPVLPTMFPRDSIERGGEQTWAEYVAKAAIA